MKIVTSDDIAEPIPAVACIGVFDGVHRGHQRVIGGCVRDALRLRLASAVITFDKDPERVLVPEKNVPQLSTLPQKTRLISLLDPDYLLMIPFDEALATLSPREFLDAYLLGPFEPSALIVGENFTFGAGAAGDVSFLREYGRGHGFEVHPLPLLSEGGEPISSTRVRSLLAAGHVSAAAALLGRPFELAGEVVPGAGRGGGLLGFHTANVAVAPELAVPAEGVYAGVLSLEGEEWPAAVNIGTRPTFGQSDAVLVEAHAIGMDEHLDMYGAMVGIGFLDRLRDERQFETRDALRAQIAKDVESARCAFEQQLRNIK